MLLFLIGVSNGSHLGEVRTSLFMLSGEVSIGLLGVASFSSAGVWLNKFMNLRPNCLEEQKGCKHTIFTQSHFFSNAIFDNLSLKKKRIKKLIVSNNYLQLLWLQYTKVHST